MLESDQEQGAYIFGQCLGTDVLLTAMDFPTLAGYNKGSQAEDTDARGSAQASKRLFSMHEHFRAGFQSMDVKRYVEWSGDEAILYQTIKGPSFLSFPS